MKEPIAQGQVDVNVSRLSQPWKDERLKLNGVYIGCVTKQNADILMAQAAMVKCLYRFIDRMNDVCPEDTADRIVSEFTAEVMPLFDAHLDALFPNRVELKTANVEHDRRTAASSPGVRVDGPVGPQGKE